MQKLLVTEAPNSQIGMYYRSDQYATSSACTKNLLFERDPIREDMSWVDLASRG
jgi:hypothetical protein